MDIPNINLHFVQTLDDMLDMQTWLGERREWLSVDIETEGLNVGRDKVRLFQLGDTHDGWAVPYQDWAGACKTMLNSYDHRVVAHNLMFEAKFLKREGMPLRSDLFHDTMIMCHLNNSLLPVALKSSAKRMLGPWAVAGQAALAAAMSKQGWTWATVPVNFEAYWAYGALDPVLTAMIAERLWPKIQDQRHMYDIEIGAIMVMRDAELRGMHIDLPYVYNKTAEMQSIMHENRPLIPDEIKNPGSDAQVLDYLRSKGAHLWKKTEKDNWSCDDDVLKEQEAANIPGAAAIRTWRRANWLENNYWRNMRNLHVDSVLRPSIKPVGARTSRMSITQPALQTIPRGNEVRNAFTAREGHSLIMCDYKQLELRIMAYDAQEPTMLEAIRNGEDLHNTVADQIYPGGWDSEGRQVAKNVNFAKGYVAGVKTFAHTAGLSMERAQKIFDDYDLRFPRIQDWQDKIIEDAKVNKYVTTLWGRRIPVNKGDEYKGVNWRIQATATSDLTKLKIIECSNHGLHDYFLLPVHDELIFEAPDDIVQDVAHEVQSVMTETQLFPGCPLNVDASIHKMWEGK